MKRPTMLVEALLRQAALDLDLSVERDIATLRCRCIHEGLSFLTIILPTLSDSLERGLESGLLTCPTYFSRNGSLPRFLGGFFRRVFTRDGRLRDDACPDTVYRIRQICRFFKKLKKECADKYNVRAIQHFIDVEGELRRDAPRVLRKDNYLDKISAIIWSQVFPEIDHVDLVCHHGPGVTADRLLSNERHEIRRWNQRSEYLFPSDLHCYPNFGIACSVDSTGKLIEESKVEYLDLNQEDGVRVVFVPKTQTTPRVIAIEPSHAQYMQQSVKDYVYKVLETHSLTKHSIRFARQDVNQRLAYSSSIDKRLATLDLKDASDRVHLELVQRIFKNSGLLEYLEDARSLHATLPNGTNLVLTKYASMGSALCFPVEAMVFYTLVQCAMHALDGKRPTSQSIKQYSKSIDIYGDDIIVPVEYADTVVRYLESYLLKVNVSKSFMEGNFRESCGADFFKGFPVNPVYARQEPHDNSRSWGPETVMSWVATANLFYMRGQWLVAQEIRNMVQAVMRRTIPITKYCGSGLFFYSYWQSTDLRYNGTLHRYEQKRTHYRPVKRKDDINGNEIACLNFWGIRKREESRSRYVAGTVLSSMAGIQSPSIENGCQQERCSVHPASGKPEDERTGLGFIRQTDAVIPTVAQPAWHSPRTEVSTEGPISMGDERVRPAPEFHFSADYCLTEEVLADPLGHLFGDSFGLDFQTSVKRGCFKSNSRWVANA